MLPVIRIQVHDTATPALRRLIDEFPPRRAHAKIGQAVRVILRDHLRAREARPNKRGWPKQHWFARARERTHYTADETAATVSVALEGFRLRYLGGEVAPVRAQALTIPAAPEAYGKRAREFSDLEFRPLSGRRAFGALVRRVGQSDQVLYWLVRAARIPADPSILPSGAAIRSAAVRALEVSFDRAAR